jgi:hypothetical protein
MLVAGAGCGHHGGHLPTPSHPSGIGGGGGGGGGGGPLHAVTSGLSHAAGGGGGAPTKAAPSGGASPGPSASDIVDAVIDGVFSGDWIATNVPMYLPPAPSAYSEMDVSVYAGLQAVVDSSGSFTLEVRATYRDFGIALRGSSYFEGDTRLDLGTLGGHYRLVHDDLLSLWADGGGAYVSTMENISLFGVMIGARIERKLNEHLGVSAGAHGYLLQDAVTILEARASVHISAVQVSYRLLHFSVGPPLHGPEVGVALSF